MACPYHLKLVLELALCFALCIAVRALTIGRGTTLLPQNHHVTAMIAPVQKDAGR